MGDSEPESIIMDKAQTSANTSHVQTLTQRKSIKERGEGDESIKPQRPRMSESEIARVHSLRKQQAKERRGEDNALECLSVVVLMVGLISIVGCIPVFVVSTQSGSEQPFLVSTIQITAYSSDNSIQLPFFEFKKLIPMLDYLGLVMVFTGAFYVLCLLEFLTKGLISVGYTGGLDKGSPIHTNLYAGIVMQLLLLLPLRVAGITSSIFSGAIILVGIGGIIVIVVTNVMVHEKENTSKPSGSLTGVYSVRFIIVALVLYLFGIFGVFAANIYIMAISGAWYIYADPVMQNYALSYVVVTGVLNMLFVFVIFVDRFIKKFHNYIAEILKMTILIITFGFHYLFITVSITRPEILHVLKTA